MLMHSASIPEKASSNSITRVVLVEDQQELCKQWLEIIDTFDDFECIETCASAEEAIERIPQIRPNIILMDIRLPQMSGIECTLRLKELLPATPIVILTVVDDDDLIFRALEAGADGYLLKWAPPADLRAALLDVLNGGAPMSSVIAHRVVRFFKQPSRSSSDVQLSAREAEILGLLSKGYYNKEIAEGIGLSIETVKTYLKGIYRKLHVRSRGEAIAWYGTGRRKNIPRRGNLLP
jgi:DNA-binding NarL/FixJ family response regulator